MLAFVMLCFSVLVPIIFRATFPKRSPVYPPAAHQLEVRRAHSGCSALRSFLPLLSRRVTDAGSILKIALGIPTRLIDLYWLIAPQFHQEGLVIHWLDVTLPVALVAAWLGCFVWQLRGRAILPVHDPQFEQALGRITA